MVVCDKDIAHGTWTYLTYITCAMFDINLGKTDYYLISQIYVTVAMNYQNTLCPNCYTSLKNT